MERLDLELFFIERISFYSSNSNLRTQIGLGEFPTTTAIRPSWLKPTLPYNLLS